LIGLKWSRQDVEGRRHRESDPAHAPDTIAAVLSPQHVALWIALVATAASTRRSSFAAAQRVTSAAR
jgi:hypothetical protein